MAQTPAPKAAKNWFEELIKTTKPREDKDSKRAK